MRQSVDRISEELAVHILIVYSSREDWGLQGEVSSIAQKNPEGGGPGDKFTVDLVAPGLEVTVLGVCCCKRWLLLIRGSRHNKQPKMLMHSRC